MADWEAKKIHDVIQDINDNTIVLPIIQRNLVWDEEKMELLFDSLLKGNSFGGIMALEDERGSQPLFAFRHFSKEGELHDSDLPPVLDRNTLLIIDGQQRLQAFYMGLMGGVNGKVLYLNLFSQGDYEFDFSRQVSDLPVVKREDGFEVATLWYPVSHLYSRLAKTNDDMIVAKEIISNRNIQDEAQKDLIRTNVRSFERVIFAHKGLGISKVYINKEDPNSERRRMVELFRRLNDGGTRLSALDLAASTLKGFDYRMEVFLRRDIPNYRDIGFGQDEVIKLLFLLQDNHNKEVTDISKEDADFAIENAPRILKTLDILRQLLKDAELYEYYRDSARSVIPLYFVAYHIFHKHEATENLKNLYINFDTNNPDFTNIKRWLYLSLLNGVFSRGKGWIPYQTGIRKILNIVSQYKNNLFPTNQLFTVYETHPLNFSQEIIDSRISQWDNNFIFYLIYGCRSLVGRDIDHIQPKVLLDQAQIPAEKIHSVSNYQLLDENTNRAEKRAKELKEWIKDWGEVECNQYLARHLIPTQPELWSIERFDDFLNARRKLIIEKVMLAIPQQASIPEQVTQSTQQIKSNFDREEFYLLLSEEQRNHPILSDNTTWSDYFIKNNLGGLQWSRRISRELTQAGIVTVSDLALMIMTLGLRISHKNSWGYFYIFDRTLPSGYKPFLHTRHFGPWSWKVVLERLQNSGFNWKEYLPKTPSMNDWDQKIYTLQELVRESIPVGIWNVKFNTKFTFHQIYKTIWASDYFHIHYEYSFSRQSLVNRRIDFMVDAEGKLGNEILNLFDKRFPLLEPEYQKRNIQYRPKRRPIAIAWKSYPILEESEGIANVFVEAFYEFNFLEGEIDAVLEEMKTK
jgi:uncharacterized protein with ParB-like and HNH nuclease domain